MGRPTRPGLTGVTHGWYWERNPPTGKQTVLLIHSHGLDHGYWSHQIEALADDWDILAVDLPGHGESEPPPPGWSFARMADDLDALLAHLACSRVHVVGCSVGGMVAQTLALAHPGRVASLSLLSTASRLPDRSRDLLRLHAENVRARGMQAALSRMETWLSPATMRHRPELRERITATLLADDPDAHAALWDLVAGFDTFDRLPEIACPTLVLVCRTDANTPKQLSAEIADRIGRSHFLVLPHEGHLSFLEAPGDVNRELASFLAGTAAPPPA